MAKPIKIIGLPAAALCFALAPASVSAEDDAALEATGGATLETRATAGAPVEQPARPAVRFGRAVDLEGADIEPVSVGIGGPDAVLGGMPRGAPLAGARMTSRFGMRSHPVLGGSRFHGGVDLAAATGTPVAATSSGRVLSAGWRGGYGILVRIAHGGSVETRYAHLSAVAVRAGDRVEAGQVIGYVGSTGRSTGPHLHYETRVGGRPVDPASSW